MERNGKKMNGKNMDGKKWQKMNGKKYGWQKIAKKLMEKKYVWQKIPEFESSPVKICWGPMTPVKIWA